MLDIIFYHLVRCFAIIAHNLAHLIVALIRLEQIPCSLFFKVPSVKKLPALPLSIVSFVRVTFLSVLVKIQRLSNIDQTILLQF